MKKELKDYLHLYLGCEVKYLLNGKGILSEVSLDSTYGLLVSVKLNGSNKHIQTIVSNIKPIIRPLSDITDEERLYFQNLCELEKEDLACIKYGTAHLTNIIQWSNGVHYLLSKHFDLFGLIEAGLAVNAAELKSVSSR